MGKKLGPKSRDLSELDEKEINHTEPSGVCGFPPRAQNRRVLTPRA